MDPDIARQMFEEGGMLVLLGMPIGTEFGIDLRVWNVAERFKGVKMIPPGLHFIYFSAVSRQGDTAPRTGFFHVFGQRELLVRHYDPTAEDLSPQDANPTEVESIRSNLRNLDRHLGAYPLESWSKWISLTQHILPSELRRMVPLSGKICSAPELVTESEAEDKGRGWNRGQGEEGGSSRSQKSGPSHNSSECDSSVTCSSSSASINITSSISPSTIHPSSSTSSTTDNATLTPDPQTSTDNLNLQQSTENPSDTLNPTPDPTSHSLKDPNLRPRLPKMFPRPGTELRFTKFPSRPYHDGATPSEMTQHCLDSTYSLRQMMENLDSPESLLSELQLAFVTFLVGQVWEGWEHWKSLLTSFCQAQKLLEEEPQMFDRLMSIMHFQINEVPEDLFVDIVESSNFLANGLATLFANITDASPILPPGLSRKADRFKAHLLAKFDWNLSLEDIGEDAPVVVEL